MLKSFVVSTLIISLVNLICIAPVTAETNADKEVRFAEKVKAGIARLGIGPEARVEIKLRDGRKLKGYISEIGDEYFVVTDAKTGTATSIPYPQVQKAKGHNTRQNIIVAVVLGFLIVGLILAAKA
jgi:hypothetical protein